MYRVAGLTEFVQDAFYLGNLFQVFFFLKKPNRYKIVNDWLSLVF